MRTLKFEWVYFQRCVELQRSVCTRLFVCLFEARMPGIPPERRVRHQSTPTLEDATRHQVALTDGCPCLFSILTLKATDSGGGGGGMSKARLVISVEHPIVSSCESLSGLDSPPGHRCVHATRSFPPVSGNRVSLHLFA